MKQKIKSFFGLKSRHGGSLSTIHDEEQVDLKTNKTSLIYAEDKCIILMKPPIYFREKIYCSIEDGYETLILNNPLYCTVSKINYLQIHDMNLEDREKINKIFSCMFYCSQVIGKCKYFDKKTLSIKIDEKSGFTINDDIIGRPSINMSFKAKIIIRFIGIFKKVFGCIHPMLRLQHACLLYNQ